MRPKNTFINAVPTVDTIISWMKNHRRILSGNVQLGVSNTDQARNISNFMASGTTPGVANTNFTITHNLGYVPFTILGFDTNNGGVIFRGTTPWTKTTVTLQCTTATATYNVRIA